MHPGDVRLSRNVIVLGLVSLLMGASSAMIHGLLPVFLVQVLGTGMVAVGAIEGTAEGIVSLAKIVSGCASDWLRRRKILVLLGYSLSAANKILFALASTASMVLAARVIDRLGKGIRDAPRDAFIADLTPSPKRGTGYGLRLGLYTVGAVGSVRRELLDHVIVWSEAHLRDLPAAYQTGCNAVRTHLGIAKDSPDHRPIQAVGAVVAVPVLGGWHHRYARI